MSGQRFHDTPGLPRPLDDGYDFIVGDRVYVDGDKPAAVAYVGEVKFAVGDWAGVVLEAPMGKHNGTVNGTEYFQCEPLHGLFVRLHRLSRYPTKSSSRIEQPEEAEQLTSSTTRSVRYNPTPITERPTGRSSSASSSTQRRSALKSPSRQPLETTATSTSYSSSYLNDDNNKLDSDNNDEMNPSNWYKRQNALDDDFETPHHEPRSLSRDSNRSGHSGLLGGYYRDRPNYSPERTTNTSNTMLHKYSSSRTPTPISVSPAPLRRQTSALSRSSRLNSEKEEHLLTPKTKSVSDAYVPTYRRAPTPDSSLRLGSRVVVNSNQGLLSGILRYVGSSSFASGQWAGVELDEPVGKNDGSMMGRRYFICPKNYGIFVPVHKVSKEYSTGIGRDRGISPSPLRNATFSRGASPRNGRSYSSLSTDRAAAATPTKSKPRSTIRRPIFTSSCMLPVTTEPKTITTKTTTTRTRTIPIERASPPLRRYKSSLSKLDTNDLYDEPFKSTRRDSLEKDFDFDIDFDKRFSSKNLDDDFDKDFGKDFEIARLTPLSPAIDKYFSSSKKNTSSSYSSRVVDYSDMY